MLLIGSHVSFDKNDQLLKATKQMVSYGGNTFMFYTGAPQNTNRFPINDEKTQEAINLMKENNISYEHLVVHAPYIINLANPNNMDFGIRFLSEELDRCNELGVKKIVLHPGSHVGIGIEEGIKNITFCLNKVFEINKTDVVVLLETMAGKGSEIGSKLEEIEKIIQNIKDKNRIGICLDTCHLNDSGYDIENFDLLLDKVDKLIGIDKIGCIHINDSKNEIASHKDRHENLGFGTIGFDKLIKVIYNERLENIPKILETPFINREFPPYKEEIEMIRNKKFDQNVFNKYEKKD